MGPDRKRTLGAAAHSSEVTVLPLSASHSVVMPSVVKVPLPYMSRPQSMLWDRLPQREGEVSMGADAKAITCGGCQQRARWCKQGVVRARS